jgi:TrmH family RNA methyltransferase
LPGSVNTAQAPRETRAMTEITSASNPVFRTLVDCLTSKGIRKHYMFMIFGEKPVAEALNRPGILVRNLVVLSGDERHVGLARSADAKSVSVLVLAKSLFEELDIFGTRAPILVLGAPKIEELDLSSSKPDGLEILCALSEPSNLGSLIRTAAAFGASRIILLRESTSPFHPKAVRAASGTTLLISYSIGPSIRDLPTLPSAREIVALDMAGTPLNEFKWPRDVRLLIGEEGQGVPSPEKFRAVSIPIAKTVESLNATIAASIAISRYVAP